MANASFQWAVIGAGAAGIYALGKLLDSGIAADQIVWIDPKFSVGDLGDKWYNVPSNTRVVLFEKFLQRSAALNFKHCPFQFDHLDGESTCLLSEVVKPLQWITEQLTKQVNAMYAVVNKINKSEQGWSITGENIEVTAKNIILAHGAKENIINPNPAPNLSSIDMQTSLNPELLAKAVSAEDTVAVYGASHSAVLIVKNLLELNCSVINFYKHPLKYAIYQSDHIIYDNTGLKGLAAKFAREHMENKLHPKLTRCYLGSANSAELLKQANKAVYAIGFHQNNAIEIEGVEPKNYDPHTGILAAGLYGFGIAFPEKVTDRYGITETSVGLFKFSNYLERVLPIWLTYAG